MRALSVRQPWAEQIASGKKKIEYRSWSRDFRGDLLIVASASRHDDDCADVRLDPDSLAYGAAVCVVDFWKVTGDEGDYKWHLREPRRVEPVAVKGYASIYHVDDGLIRTAKARRAPAAVTAKAKAKPAAQIARPRLPADAPSVLIAARDPRLVRRWMTSLRALGCRVEAVRDGYSAWRHLSSHSASCLVLDADVQGYSAWEVVTLMRKTQVHLGTPVIFAGGERVSSKENLWRVGRAASADDVAHAVQTALAAQAK